MSRGATLLIVAVALGAAVGGYFAGSHWLNRPATTTPAVGQHGGAAPAFELPDLDGQSVTLDDFQGRAVLLNFWATWCAPCRREMPALTDLAASLDPSRAAVVGIALDREADVRSFVVNLGVGYPILLAGDIEGTRLAQRYGNPQVLLPYSVFVGPDGTIDHAVLGEVEMESARARLARLAGPGG